MILTDIANMLFFLNSALLNFNDRNIPTAKQTELEWQQNKQTDKITQTKWKLTKNKYKGLQTIFVYSLKTNVLLEDKVRYWPNTW